MRSCSPTQRAELVRAVAIAIEAAGEEIIARADRETALGRSRLEGELARTTGQLRFLADVVNEGAYLDAVIDRPNGGSDLRRWNIPLGPVAVFAASNFPLAFSVAGGDTAAALAVGCPVVVKAHPSHPGTSELTARAVAAGLKDAGAPAGVFSMLHGFAAGGQLVMDERIAAVSFTGSVAGGLALADLVRGRETPIPVFAEMGSVNPVVVTAGALQDRFDDIVAGFVGSFTMGVGQFCTKPGVVFVPDADRDRVGEALLGALNGREGQPMLNNRIRSAWSDRLAEWGTTAGVSATVDGTSVDGTHAASPHVLSVSAARFSASPALHEECFGPAALVAGYRTPQELAEALGHLRGNLTGSVHANIDELDGLRPIVDQLTRQVGRLVWNGWPTGVAVGWAMHHGGPYPASTDASVTSVGAGAVRRFVRPIAFQDAPPELLPDALQDANPLAIPRREEGSLTQ